MNYFAKSFILGSSLLVLGAQAQSPTQPQPQVQPQAPQEIEKLKEADIQEAYNYFIGRLLILRQEHIDFKENGYKWNTLYPREVGEVTWANPNLDVAYSEAWLAIDENSCAIVEMPSIKDRYYTFQVLNTWGETVSNINERTMSKKPFGRFAFCTKNTKARVANNIQRIDLEGKKFRVLARIELGANPEVAKKLQSEIKLTMQGTPKIDEPVEIPIFDNRSLIGAEGFEKADAIIKANPDINPGMEQVQEKVRLLSAAVNDNARRAKINNLLKTKIIPAFLASVEKMGTEKNGWQKPEVIGNYKQDYLARSYINLVGIWANNKKEVIYYGAVKDSNGKALNGNNVYAMTFSRNELPQKFANYFWSITAVDAVDHKVMENPEKRYNLSTQSRLVQNKDGSMTVVFASKLPEGFNQENWIPIKEGIEFKLTLRLYGPKNDKYFPPPIGHMVRSMQAQEAKPAE